MTNTESPIINEHPKVDVMSPDVTMMLLTWVTFFILLAILYKFAWKPILDALQKREDYIRRSLDEADQARKQLAEIEEVKKQILNEARDRAQEIMQQSRKTAVDLAAKIEARAKQQAEAIVANARDQTTAEYNRLKESLKKEVVETSVNLAERILKENLDRDKNRRLIDEAIKEI